LTIDGHQHFWSVGDGRYDYPRATDGVLYRDFGPEDLAASLARGRIDQTIVVQAVEAEWETRHLLSISSSTDWIAGVVGWCDLGQQTARGVLDGYLNAGPLVAVRPMLQKHDDASWLLSGNASSTLDWLAGKGLVFEALVDVRHLEVVASLAGRHPDLSIVVDHMAKPWRHPDKMSEWSTGMRQVSKHANSHVKVSGYPFAVAGDDEGYADLCRSLLDWFGTDRLIWGSDWPVSIRHLPYERTLARAHAAFSEAVWEQVGHANAQRVYGILRPGKIIEEEVR
jgi:L-fuconolactonase